jgi:hypothetical protein
MRVFVVALLVLVSRLQVSAAQQQEPPIHDAQALAKQLANPLLFPR